jgi:hypothetical protein
MNTDGVGNNNIKTDHRYTTNTVDPECAVQIKIAHLYLQKSLMYIMTY